MYNCIGVNNHRNFFLYIIFLTIGIILYDLILYYCKLPPPKFLSRPLTPAPPDPFFHRTSC